MKVDGDHFAQNVRLSQLQIHTQSLPSHSTMGRIGVGLVSHGLQAMLKPSLLCALVSKVSLERGLAHCGFNTYLEHGWFGYFELASSREDVPVFSSKCLTVSRCTGVPEILTPLGQFGSGYS